MILYKRVLLVANKYETNRGLFIDSGDEEMKTRFINFEGIHGSGKSACAWNLYSNLKERGMSAKVYFEYDIDHTHENPCDLNFLAVLKKNELEYISEKYAKYTERIMSNIKQYGDYYCIFYTIFSDVPELVDELKLYKAYEGRLDANDFIQLDIALMNEHTYIFESVMFQQILNELILFSDCTDDNIVGSVLLIEKALQPLNPTIFYLKPDDLKGQIDKVAAERVSDNYELYPDWIDWMVEYVKNSKYGKKYSVKNQVDLMAYFLKRAEMEKIIFESLTINKKEIAVRHIDYQVENQYIYHEVVK